VTRVSAGAVASQVADMANSIGSWRGLKRWRADRNNSKYNYRIEIINLFPGALPLLLPEDEDPAEAISRDPWCDVGAPTFGEVEADQMATAGSPIVAFLVMRASFQS
jgi:hypothetical protein